MFKVTCLMSMVVRIEWFSVVLPTGAYVNDRYGSHVDQYPKSPVESPVPIPIATSRMSVIGNPA